MATTSSRIPAQVSAPTASAAAEVRDHNATMALGRTLLLVASGLLVVVISLWSSLSQLPDTRFHPDESRWINRASYLEDLFHPFSATWEDRYLTRGQPPVGSYVTGLGLLLQGRDLTTNGPWDFRYGNEGTVTWNVTRGNLPSWGDLQAARRTSAVLAALTALAAFAVVAALTNWVGGLVAGLVFAIHPLTVYLSTLATADALFTFLFAASVVAIVWLARRPSWPRAVLLGVILGLGAGTKLSPLLVALALAGYGAALLLARVAIRWRPFDRVTGWLPGLRDAATSRLAWMLVALPLITTTTFVATYPYLWPAPVARTRALFAFRQDEMNAQASIWPEVAVDTRRAAVSHLWKNLEHQYSSSGKIAADLGHRLGRQTRSTGIDLPVAFAGFLLLIALALRQGVGGPAMLAGLLMGLQGGAILVGLKVDFNRYYLPLVFVVAVGIGLLAGFVWSAIRHLIRRVDLQPARTPISQT